MIFDRLADGQGTGYRLADGVKSAEFAKCAAGGTAVQGEMTISLISR